MPRNAPLADLPLSPDAFCAPGDLSEARRRYEELLQDPRQPRAKLLNNLGSVLQLQGRLIAAEKAFQEAVALATTAAQAQEEPAANASQSVVLTALNNLARCCIAADKPLEAAEVPDTSQR